MISLSRYLGIVYTGYFDSDVIYLFFCHFCVNWNVDCYCYRHETSGKDLLRWLIRTLSAVWKKLQTGMGKGPGIERENKKLCAEIDLFCSIGISSVNNESS